MMVCLDDNNIIITSTKNLPQLVIYTERLILVTVFSRKPQSFLCNIVETFCQTREKQLLLKFLFFLFSNYFNFVITRVVLAYIYSSCKYKYY